MERIICDTYVKGEKHTWSADKDDWSNQEFNRKILAVNAMYGWLYEKGILRDVSFEVRDYSDVTFFALDAKDLEPYREQMAASGLKDADVALWHIFDEYYTPCEYSGAIELGWTMMGYRDVDGCVGRSWECGLIKGLESGTVHDIQAVLYAKGVKEAVRAAFMAAGFEPSDITNDGLRLFIKPLSKEHLLAVETMDDMSGNYVLQWLEDNEDYAWGLFAEERLVGYCSIGRADDCREEIEGYPGYTYDSLLLSDVFVLPEYRGQGFGSFMVNEAVKLRTEEDKQLVFLTVMYDRLSQFYEKIGFLWVGNGVMVRDERPFEVRKFEVDFAKAFEHYSAIDRSMAEHRDYLEGHGDKLIYCFQNNLSLDLIGVDFWAQYEELLGEPLSHDEYLAVNSVLDGDPYDIEENDAEKISFLREALVGYRKEGYTWEPSTILSLIEDAVLRVKDLSTADKGVVKNFVDIREANQDWEERW